MALFLFVTYLLVAAAFGVAIGSALGSVNGRAERGKFSAVITRRGD
jgi:hypothetical protein